MFELIKSSQDFSDATALYDVKLDKSYTLGEFVDTVLTITKEWGIIRVVQEGVSWIEYPKCEYRYGKFFPEKSWLDLPPETLNKKIVLAKAHGGWSNMDYTLTLEGSNNAD